MTTVQIKVDDNSGEFKVLIDGEELFTNWSHSDMDDVLCNIETLIKALGAKLEYLEDD